MFENSLGPFRAGEYYIVLLYFTHTSLKLFSGNEEICIWQVCDKIHTYSRGNHLFVVVMIVF